MYIKETNGTDRDFHVLISELEQHLNMLAGGEENRQEYMPHNALHDIHDVFIAYIDENPVGCASFKQYEEGVAELKRVYVKPDYRGKGIAEQLVNTVSAAAGKKGFQTLILETGKTFTAAVNLYQKLGFVITDHYEPYIGMEDSVCMRKEL